MANLLALRYDDRETWEAQHEWERFENNYKDEGYITAAASSLCEVDEYDLNMTTKAKTYADKRPLDYEFFGVACDPNSMPNHSLDGFKNAFKGPFSEFRRCIYGEDSSKHQLDFTLEFWRKYKDLPKVQMVTLMDAHEFTGELVTYLDDHLPTFFDKMISEGLLDDSIVFILSDHGNNSNLFFKGTQSGKNELANPFMMMLLSENNALKYGEKLVKNEQKLISPHDVNRVLNELIGASKEYKGSNFLLHELDPMRTCGAAGISPDFCRCNHTEEEYKVYLEHMYEYEGTH
jgi:arylsulfatase A-like enzyme